jgi:hypothetical protein
MPEAIALSVLARTGVFSSTLQALLHRLAASDFDAPSAFAAGLHRVALSSLLSDVASPREVRASALQLLGRFTTHPSVRNATLHCLGPAHWEAILDCAIDDASVPELKAVAWAVLRDAAADMNSLAGLTDSPLYAGLAMMADDASTRGLPAVERALAWGSRASTACESAAPEECLCCSALGLRVMARAALLSQGHVSLGALSGASSALGLSAKAIVRSVISPNLSRAQAAWLRALCSAATALAPLCSHSLAEGSGHDESTADRFHVDWASVGGAVLLSCVTPALSPPDEGLARLSRLGHEALIASLPLLRDTTWPQEIALPALQLAVLAVLAPAVLESGCRGGAAGVLPDDEMQVPLAEVLVKCLGATLQSLPRPACYDVALVRPPVRECMDWLGASGAEPAELLGRAAAWHALLTSANRAVGEPLLEGHVPSLSWLTRPIVGAPIHPVHALVPPEPSIVDPWGGASDSESASLLGLPGVPRRLAEDMASASPTPRARRVLHNAYRPFLDFGAKTLGKLPVVSILKASRAAPQNREGSSDGAPVYTALPSMVDCLCGMTRNGAPAVRDAAVDVLRGLLLCEHVGHDAEASSDAESSQLLIAQAWLASTLCGTVAVMGADHIAATARELSRWAPRNRELPLSAFASLASAASAIAVQDGGGVPGDLLPPYVRSGLKKAKQALTDSAQLETASGTLFSTLDEIAFPYLQAPSALHVHMLKALAFAAALPRDSESSSALVGGGGCCSSSPRQQAAAKAVQQGVLHPLLFMTRWYTSRLSSAVSSAAQESGDGQRALFHLQRDSSFRMSVAVLRQCLRLGANAVNALCEVHKTNDALSVRAWLDARAEWHALCVATEHLEDLKTHCHAVRLVSNFNALGADAGASPRYGDNISPLIQLPPLTLTPNQQTAVAQRGSCSLDVVLVHGLQGAGLKTWRAGNRWAASHDPDDKGFTLPLSAEAEEKAASAAFPMYCLYAPTGKGALRRIPLWPSLWLAPALVSRGVTPRLLCVHYDSDVWASASVRPPRSLEQVSYEIYAQLREARAGGAEEGTGSPVVFIAHSMVGGCLLRTSAC